MKTLLTTLILQLIFLPIASRKSEAQTHDLLSRLNQGVAQMEDLEKSGWKFFNKEMEPVGVRQLIAERAADVYMIPAPKPGEERFLSLILHTQTKFVGAGIKTYLLAHHLDNGKLSASIANTTLRLDPTQSSAQNNARWEMSLQVFSNQIEKTFSRNSMLRSTLLVRVLNFFVPSAEAKQHNWLIPVAAASLVLGILATVMANWMRMDSFTIGIDTKRVFILAGSLLLTALVLAVIDSSMSDVD